MVLSEEKIKTYIKRLLLARMRILCNNGFYGLLLMHMTYSIDESAETAWTDGKRIAFSPKFMDSLSDSELDFVLMHEILHVVLRHCARGENRDHDAFNIACDIVVNSNIKLSCNGDLKSITLKQWGVSMHLAPDGKEGYHYTAEEVYEMLPKGKGGKNGKVEKKEKDDGGGFADGRAKKENGKTGQNPSRIWDDHTHWSEYEEDDEMRDVWVKRFEDVCKSVEIREATMGRGVMPAFAERLWKEMKKPQTDWRTILNDFVQEEINDYSFSPPDRRFDDSPFFLPDFNGKDDLVEDILFMIDTSGSMSDTMIAHAFSEVKRAIEQFDGKLKGWLGFFDAAIIEPKPFSDMEEFKLIKAAGGGGTDFQIIFEYVAKYMKKSPASIIILTDGYAPFPQEKLTGGIPVLWLLNNEDVQPPWGKVARIKV